MKAKYEITEVIGLDLGDGEFSLAQLSIIAGDGNLHNRDPEVIQINNKSSQPTAVALSKKKDREGKSSLIIGANATTSNDISSLEINFKKKPPFEEHQERVIRDFCNTLFDKLDIPNDSESSRKYMFFVGCPSAWDEDVRQLYQKILSTTKLSNVVVAKESRAAFLHAKESGKFTVNELKSGVLVIDIGSSTTDFTFVHGSNDDPVENDYGLNLGAKLIEQRIFDLVLSQHERRHDLERFFKENESAKSRVLFRCREFKERYFDRLETHEEQEDCPVYFETLVLNKNDGLVVQPKLTHNDIQEKVLNYRFPELGNRSWIEAYRQELQNVGLKIMKETDHHPEKILITGSASKMQFTREICKEIFDIQLEEETAGKNKRLIELGTEPEQIVSRGLARWGRVYILTEDFATEAKAFIQEDVPRIIEENIQTLIKNLSEDISVKVLNKVITDAADKWNKEVISDENQMLSEINQEIVNYFSSDDCFQLENRLVNEHINKVLIKKINEGLNPICNKHNSLGLTTNLLREFKFDITRLPSKTSYDSGLKASKFTYQITYKEGGGLGSGLFGAALGAGAVAGTAAAVGLALTGPIMIGVLVGTALIGGLIGGASETKTKTARKILNKKEIDDFVNEGKQNLAKRIQNHYDEDIDGVKQSLIQDTNEILQLVLIEQVERARLLAA